MAEGALQFNVASVLEHVLQQYGKRLSDIDFASRKAQEASLRRYDAARWLRKMVGVVAGKDLPAEPSEEHFRIGLRSGIILCNALNKVNPGVIPKVIEGPTDTVIIPDASALSAFQYFENVRNFLTAIKQMGIPTFEASDLEKGGKLSRLVNCVLALKSYHEWKQWGGNGPWKYSGNTKTTDNQTVTKSSDPFMNLTSRSSSGGDRSLDNLPNEENSYDSLSQGVDEMETSQSLQILICELISDKNREDIPSIVEHMLTKVMEEFEQRLAGLNAPTRTTLQHTSVSSAYENGETECKNLGIIKDENQFHNDLCYDGAEGHSLVPQGLVGFPQRSIQVKELKKMLHSVKVDMQILQMKHQEELSSLDEHLMSMAHAASRYQSVVEENRKLYNQVQDLKGNIRVYCRIRPFQPGQPNRVVAVEDVDETTVSILTPSKYGKGKKAFTFNKVFGPSSSQEEVFVDTQPLIRSVLDGYNVCIFAYGQTGSGKTHTMTGPDELTAETVGVNYRALSDLFLISEQRSDTIAYDISVQMLEIYNEQVRDLLSADSLNKRLEIRNNSLNGMNVLNANLVPVTSTPDVINLMNLGHKNRAVGSTAMNDRSSRSHSCLTVHVKGRDLSTGAVLHGCMHLVDLAGSERVDKTEAAGDRLKEAQHINKSLSALGDVISSLAQKNSHIPYRNSKLTQLLQHSLGGQAKTLMFVHISPEPDAIGETISTLKFAERVSTVELGAARANKETTDVKELKEQIASMKAALSHKEGEPVYLQQSGSSSPDIQKFYGSSPSQASWSSITDAYKTEGQSASASTSRRHSLDSQDFLMHSPPWTVLRSSLELAEEEKGEVFYEKRIRDASNAYPEQSVNKKASLRRHSLDNGFAKHKYEITVADDSDDGDSSELDYQPRSNLEKCISMPNVAASKLRRPSPRPTKSQDMRSQIPQPSKTKVSAGSRSPLRRTGRQTVSNVGRRKPGCGK